jgi:hypothetical protein
VAQAGGNILVTCGFTRSFFEPNQMSRTNASLREAVETIHLLNLVESDEQWQVRGHCEFLQGSYSTRNKVVVGRLTEVLRSLKTMKRPPLQQIIVSVLQDRFQLAHPDSHP